MVHQNVTGYIGVVMQIILLSLDECNALEYACIHTPCFVDVVMLVLSLDD